METKSYPAKLEPMLAPNKLLDMDIPLEKVRYPMLYSKKYNGIRGLAHNGVWRSRNMSELAIHPILLEQFKELLDYAQAARVVLDGEFHCNSHNTVGETRSILAGRLPTPDDFRFKCFYSIPYSVWNGVVKLSLEDLTPIGSLPGHRSQIVEQRFVKSAEQLRSLITEGKTLSIEGYMLIKPEAFYKHGRVTLREGTMLKYKYYGDKEDAKIISLMPRRVRRADAASKEHETGYAKQVYTQDSFIETNVAGTMLCHLEGDPKQPIHVPFPVGFGMAERQQAYHHFGTGSEYDLQGQWLCFRRLNCESRDKPIAIKQVEFRDSK